MGGGPHQSRMAVRERVVAGPPDRRILLLSAGMGEGHNGVAAELARRLEARGHDVDVVDLWDLLPLRIGHLIEGFYRFTILYLPWLYEAIYRIWLAPKHPKPRRSSMVVRLAVPRVERCIASRRPVAAVSTFHLSSQVLGEMRRAGKLHVPVTSVVVDFAAHSLWVHPDVDLHVCLHHTQVPRLQASGATRVATPGPVVAPEFLSGRSRRADARARFGLDDRDRVVLVVAGSWGAGRIVSTVRSIAADGRFTPLVACGHNTRLLRKIGRIEGALALGWTSGMEEVFAASDVMVGNAGGLTAMEAIATGTPVVSYKPIPGHGRDNVKRMEEAGIIRYARSRDQLLALLDELTASPRNNEFDSVMREGAAMFRHDAADDIAALRQVAA